MAVLILAETIGAIIVKLLQIVAGLSNKDFATLVHSQVQKGGQQPKLIRMVSFSNVNAAYHETSKN
jgi:hypothetical protein